MHVLRAVNIAAFVFPFLHGGQRRARVQRFSRQLLKILAVRTHVTGEPPYPADAPAMIVANHVSWLDIFSIDSVHPMRFVAKSEIRRWPVIGWLCKQGGTLFIQRERRRHTVRVNEQVADALKRGETVAVFPEGTITAGDVVLPFHASLLQPAFACSGRLFPVAISYSRADGSRCSEADYAGTKTLLETLRLMLTQPEIHAHLKFLPPLACAGTHRRELAHEAALAIAAALNVPAPPRRTEKSYRPPA